MLKNKKNESTRTSLKLGMLVFAGMLLLVGCASAPPAVEEFETLESIIYFAPDSSLLTGTTLEEIILLEKQLSPMEITQIRVVGHTTSLGNMDGMQISIDRAQAVFDYLNQDGSLNNVEAEILGVGDADADASEDNPALLRRVEVSVLKKVTE